MSSNPTYRSERDMYPEVSGWLRLHLKARFPDAQIMSFDTHAFSLKDFIRRKGLQRFFDSTLWQTYDIAVDVTAFIRAPRLSGVVFVECKTRAITLRDLSQLLGYSRVAAPLESYILSVRGISGTLMSLVLTYGRQDVLEYDWPKGQKPRRIVLAKWDPARKGLDATSVLPPGLGA